MINPYQPNHVDEADAGPLLPISSLWRRYSVLMFGGAIAFVFGSGWIEWLQNQPTLAGPLTWTIAQLIAYGGIAIGVIGLLAWLHAGIHRIIDRSEDPPDPQAKLGWNIVPMVFTSAFGVIWFGAGCLLLWATVFQVYHYDLRRGAPVYEIMCQSLLCGVFFQSVSYCWRSIRQWRRMKLDRALLLSGLGCFGPIVAFVLVRLLNFI